MLVIVGITFVGCENGTTNGSTIGIIGGDPTAVTILEGHWDIVGQEGNFFRPGDRSGMFFEGNTWYRLNSDDSLRQARGTFVISNNTIAFQYTNGDYVVHPFTVSGNRVTFGTRINESPWTMHGIYERTGRTGRIRGGKFVDN